MDVKTYRSYTEDSTLELPLARLAPRLLGSLDPFLDALDAQFPDIVDRVVARLVELAREETPDGPPSAPIPSDLGTDVPSVHASRYPELYATHVDLICGLLGLDYGALWVAEPTELSQQRFIRVRFLPGYLKLLALADAVGRASAIAFFKPYLDRTIADMPNRPGGPETLTELRERQIEFNLQEQGMDWTQAIVGEHQYLNKVTVCRIQKVLAEYDPELMDVVACYPDFAMLRKTHPRFVLSRTQTLMCGGTCCDSCYHDERHATNFVHPPLAVFDSLPDPAIG
jgi:hypothetical protein